MTITNEDIAKILTICDAASRGPAEWARSEMTRDEALANFTAHLDKAAEVTGSHALNQVQLPTDDEGALCVAITGNGPTSAANAKFFVTAMDPVYGFAAALRELRDLRAQVLTGLDALREQVEQELARSNGMPESGRKA